MEILSGKELSLKIRQQLKEQVQKEYINCGKNPPTLAVVLVGNNLASEIYVRNKERACAEVGLNSKTIKLPENATMQEIKHTIEQLNEDKSVSGILLQLPLPNKDMEAEIVETISPNKDVDALTLINKGKLASNLAQIAPCTPCGIIDLLKESKTEIAGKNVVVIGRSQLVGRPVATMLTNMDATVTICHSKTKDLKEVCKNADILIVAIGKPKMINSEYIKDGAVVIDVGINRENGKVVGDVDIETTACMQGIITPVPGGVGPMTITELIKNTIILAKNQE